LFQKFKLFKKFFIKTQLRRIKPEAIVKKEKQNSNRSFFYRKDLKDVKNAPEKFLENHTRKIK
jgi:hypothetical protein